MKNKISNTKHKEKYIFSALFLSGMFALSGLSIAQTLPELMDTVRDTGKQIEMIVSPEKQEAKQDDNISGEDTKQEAEAETIGEAVKAGLLRADTNISENVYRRYDWIEGYGLVNRLLGKKEINGFSYAIDKEGSYHSLNFWNSVRDHDDQRFSQQLQMLRDSVEAKGGHMMFLAYPNKYYASWSSGYSGMPYNDYNEKMDELLLWNRRYGIDTIDYRKTMESSGLSYDEMFYDTDHHWTGYAAFLAFQQLVEHLNERYDSNLDPDGYYRNIENYEVEWHKNTFLGSAGRSVGLSFGDKELEDFQTVTPKFDANITWNGRTGNYTDTVLDEKKLVYDNLYESDMYGYYMGGVYARDSIVNHDNPDGLKIFFIRDSYASPMIVNMIPFCSQIDCVWGKYATDRYVKKMIESNDYDYVFVAYYTNDILPNFFHFYEDDYAKEKEK